MQLIRRLVALFGGVLVAIGVWLEDLAGQPANEPETCQRCDGHIVLDHEHLERLLTRAARKEHLRFLMAEADVLCGASTAES